MPDESMVNGAVGDEQVLAAASEAFADMLANWNRMSASDPDEAGDDAERFEQSFYVFARYVVRWLRSVPDGPRNAEEAMRMSVIESFRARLPGPLVLNFETEVEEAFSGRDRLEDDA